MDYEKLFTKENVEAFISSIKATLPTCQVDTIRNILNNTDNSDVILEARKAAIARIKSEYPKYNYNTEEANIVPKDKSRRYASNKSRYTKKNK